MKKVIIIAQHLMLFATCFYSTIVLAQTQHKDKDEPDELTISWDHNKGYIHQEFDVNGTPSFQYETALMELNIEKDSVLASYLLLSSAGGGGGLHMSPSNCWSYKKPKINDQARNKMIELSNIRNSHHHAHFLAMLGCLYFAEKNYKDAERTFKEAYNEGSLLAAMELGIMYFYINANDPRYLDNKEDDDLPWSFENWMSADNKNEANYLKSKLWSDKDNVAYWLEMSIDNGLGFFPYGDMPYNVYNHLIYVYYDGVGVKANEKKALDVALRFFSDPGFWDSGGNMDAAMNSLFFVYDHPEIINEEQKDKLLQLYYLSKANRLSSDEKINESMLSRLSCALGIYYYKKKAYKEAFKFLFESASKENCQAMKILADCYKYGRGTPVNKKKEKELREKAKGCDCY